MLRYRRREHALCRSQRSFARSLAELAEDRRRWGYRRLHVLLQREGWTVNSKRVYRIYVEEKRWCADARRRRICAKARVLLAAPVRKNETWTMDFLQGCIGLRPQATHAVDLRCVYAGDAGDRSRYLVAGSARSTSVGQATATSKACQYGFVIDNGTQFTSKALDQWAYQNKITLRFITPGRPMENGYIETFHGKFRERSGSTNTGSSLWTMRGRPSKAGGSITTRCARTALWAT